MKNHNYYLTGALTLCAIASGALLLPVAASAKRHGSLHPSEERKPVTSAAEEASLQNALIENAPAEFAETNEFVFASKNRKFVLGLGGFAKATASFDFGSPIDNAMDFVVSDIPMNPGRGNGGKIQFSAQTTSLYTNFVFNPGKDQVGAFIGIDFTGNNYTPTMQYGFIRYKGFQAGYDETLFCDPSNTPPSIDNEGPNAYPSISTVGLRYTGSWGKQKEWTAGVGIELPQASYTVGNHTRWVSQRVPDIPAFIKYSWDQGNSWVRLAGILRNMSYRDLSKDKNKISTGWGLSLSGKLEILPSQLSFVYQGTYGHGISSYYQDINGDNLDLLPSVKKEGKLNAAPSWGGFAGLQYNFTSKCYASLSYSHLRVYDDDSSVGGDQYRYGQYALANVFYDINPYLTWGVEYIYGRRVNMNGTQNHDNRIQTMLQFSF